MEIIRVFICIILAIIALLSAFVFISEVFFQKQFKSKLHIILSILFFSLSTILFVAMIVYEPTPTVGTIIRME